MERNIYDRYGNKLGEIREVESDGHGIGCGLGFALALMFILGVIFIWPALFEVGGWLSVVMMGTQIVSHIIVGVLCLNGEKDSFSDILKTMCLWATISSGLLTWLFSGTNILMLLTSFLIAFLASVGSGLIAATVVVLLQKSVYKESVKDEKRIAEQSKKYKPNSEKWRCKCGVENSSNYSICKKCGEYRNTEESRKTEEEREAERIRKIILEYDATKESNTWMCTCGTKNKTEYGHCKKCGSYRGNIKI